MIPNGQKIEKENWKLFLSLLEKIHLGIISEIKFSKKSVKHDFRASFHSILKGEQTIGYKNDPKMPPRFER